MKTSDYSYNLPPERIAQAPIEPRDHSRLLVLDRATGQWNHHHFFDIPTFLRPGDLLVMNESRVFNARLMGKIGEADIEIFLLRPNGTTWKALAKPGKKCQPGTIIRFTPDVTATVINKMDDGTIEIDFHLSAKKVFELTEAIGQVPLPPYISNDTLEQNRYQTVYAKTTGSVAAPTAGFHFTQKLLEQLREQGIKTAFVTLHVGLGTFRPIKTETLEEHQMHEEWVHIPEETTELIRQAKENGGRVIAVGTTSVRALESGINDGFTNIFITPGYHFNIIDGLITNFHLPQSTLTVLVSAFIGEHLKDADEGRKILLNAYQDAIEKEYRFYSFGDAMLIQ